MGVPWGRHTYDTIDPRPGRGPRPLRRCLVLVLVLTTLVVALLSARVRGAHTQVSTWSDADSHAYRAKAEESVEEEATASSSTPPIGEARERELESELESEKEREREREQEQESGASPHLRPLYEHLGLSLDESGLVYDPLWNAAAHNAALTPMEEVVNMLEGKVEERDAQVGGGRGEDVRVPPGTEKEPIVFSRRTVRYLYLYIYIGYVYA